MSHHRVDGLVPLGAFRPFPKDIPHPLQGRLPFYARMKQNQGKAETQSVIV